MIFGPQIPKFADATPGASRGPADRARFERFLITFAFTSSLFYYVAACGISLVN